MTKGKEQMSEQTIFKMQAAQRDFPLFFFLLACFHCVARSYRALLIALVSNFRFDFHIDFTVNPKIHRIAQIGFRGRQTK